MYRIAMEKLLKWKESKRRKPLIIEGARQVGKTWLMKEFGRLYYTDTVYINFDSNSRMAELFASDLDTERLIMGLELYSGRKIDPDHTLLIFDEVQEVPRALSSLKYFYENAPEYHIVCAGSLLGIALHEGTSFPVGKVDFLKLYPLSFKEFLMATGKDRFAELLNKQDYPMITSFKQTFIDALKQYYFVGGMPEAVQSFAENKDFNEVREIQKRILAAYEQDFSKHAPNEIVPKIRMLWNSSNDVMDAIIDKFGKEVTVLANDMQSFRAIVNTAVGRVFYSWVFGFAGKVTIKSPEDVKKSYAIMVKQAAQALIE